MTEVARGSTLSLGASIVAAIGWGFGGVLAALTWAPGVVLTFYRMAIAAALLTGIALWSGRRIDWRVLRISCVGGALLAADMMLFFSAIKLTSVAVASVIGALQPALVLLVAGPLFGERVSRAKIIWTAIAISGVAVMVDGAGAPGHRQLFGDLLAIGSLVAWSGYFVVSKHTRSRVEALEYTTGVTITGALFTLPVVFITGESLAEVHASDWLWIVLLALIPGTAHLLMNWAHRHLDASVSSVITSGNPIVSVTAAYFILGQLLKGTQIVGGLVGIAAIGFVAAGSRPSSSPTNTASPRVRCLQGDGQSPGEST